MTVTINGSTGISSPGGDTSTSLTTTSLNSQNTFGFKNRLIDAGFIINQRVYVSGTSLSAGTYAHDRWKGGASGGTYTFTQGSLGVPIVITITAGAIQQIIEGCNVPEGGTYVLSWTGTATASINGGTAGSSPLAVTGVTAGANMTIQFNTGTVSYPQLEKGSTATSFDYRPYGTELALCQRYLPAATGNYCLQGQCASTTQAYLIYKFPVTARTAPTGISTAGGTGQTITNSSMGNVALSAIAFSSGETNSGMVLCTVASGLTAGNATTYNTNGGQLLFTGCEL